MELFDSNNTFPYFDGYGVNTLAFVVNSRVEDGEEVFSIEKMKCFMEEVDNGYVKTFFINKTLEPDEKKDIVFLTLRPGEAALNTAAFVNGKLIKRQEMPEIIKHSKIEGEQAEYKEFKYAPNFKRPIAIVDPEIGDEVKPILYFDTEANDIRAKIRLVPHKSYIALEVRND